MIPWLPTTRLMLTLIVGLLLGISAFAQNGFVSNQAKISRTYEDLSAVYAVVAADGLTTVYCKFKNDSNQPILVVLTITKASGGTSQRQVEVLAGSLAAINIGDIASVSVSITKLNQGENGQDKRFAERAVLRDQLTKLDGKLTAIGFDKSAAGKEVAPTKIDRSVRTTKVIEIIFGKGSMDGLSQTNEDHKIADYFLKELVDGSCRMSYAKVLFETAYNFDPDILDIVSDLIKAHDDNCGKGAQKGEYYQTIVVSIRAKYRTAFHNRKQNGEWLMTIR